MGVVEVVVDVGAEEDEAGGCVVEEGDGAVVLEGAAVPEELEGVVVVAGGAGLRSWQVSPRSAEDLKASMALPTLTSKRVSSSCAEVSVTVTEYRSYGPTEDPFVMATVAAEREGRTERELGTLVVTLRVGADCVVSTAAVTVMEVSARQLCGLWKKTVSFRGKPLPLLSWSSVSPLVRAMRTVKDEIPESAGMFAKIP